MSSFFEVDAVYPTFRRELEKHWQPYVLASMLRDVDDATFQNSRS